MGVNINTTIAITFFIGSALAGAAGVVQGLYFGNVALQHRLPGRPEGVHGGRPGRHRQHDRRGARRLPHRLRRGHQRRARAMAAGREAVGLRGPRSSCSSSGRPACSASSWESGHERRPRLPTRGARPPRPGCARQAFCAGTGHSRSSSAWRWSRSLLPLIVHAAAVQRLQRQTTCGSTASPTPASSSCWRSD